MKPLFFLLLISIMTMATARERLEITSPALEKGDTHLAPGKMIIFTVYADTPLSGVKVSLRDITGKQEARLNNERSLILRPVGGDLKQWDASYEIDTFSPAEFKAGQIRATAKLQMATGAKVIQATIPGGYKGPSPDDPEPEEFAASFPKDYSWVKNLRREHPRIFINREMIPSIRAWAEKIGYKYLLENADSFRFDPTLTRKTRGYTGDKPPYLEVDVEVPVDWANEAMTCALAYIITGDRKYAEKTFEFLNASLKCYEECFKKRTAISWFGLPRILELAAYDWIYETLSDEQRKHYITEFFRINTPFVTYGWFSPIAGLHGGLSTRTGFYGDKNTIFFMGLAAYGDGYCDEEAEKMLKWGYDLYRNVMLYRERTSRDDGLLSTACIGYSTKQYPWCSYDFLLAWRAAITGSELPVLNHLLYFAEWYRWNILPGNNPKQPMRQFGIGDAHKTESNMELPNISSHLFTILSLYKERRPQEARYIAGVLSRINQGKKVDASLYSEEKNLRVYYMKGGPRAHNHSMPLFRHYLLYNMGEPIEAETPPARMARPFENSGVTIMNSGMKPDSTYALFNCGSQVPAHKSRGDENNFIIFKKGYLAIDSGTRLQDNTPHSIKYNQSSLAHNTILIDIPEERFANDEKILRAQEKIFLRRSKGDPEIAEMYKRVSPYYDLAMGGQYKQLGGKLEAFQTNDTFTYLAGNATEVYDPRKCERFTRQFVFLPPDNFVVYDRVISVKPEYRKTWLLHLQDRPEIDGKTMRAHSSEDGKLTSVTLLPENAALTLVGGPGKEFSYKDLVNWDIHPEVTRKHKNLYFGQYRLEVTPGTEKREDTFLHLLQTGDAPMAQSELIKSAEKEGVKLKLQDGRQVELHFNRTGQTEGSIRISDNTGKELYQAELTNTIQPQAGF